MEGERRKKWEAERRFISAACFRPRQSPQMPNDFYRFVLAPCTYILHCVPYFSLMVNWERKWNSLDERTHERMGKSGMKNHFRLNTILVCARLIIAFFLAFLWTLFTIFFVMESISGWWFFFPVYETRHLIRSKWFGWFAWLICISLQLFLSAAFRNKKKKKKKTRACGCHRQTHGTFVNRSPIWWIKMINTPFQYGTVSSWRIIVAWRTSFFFSLNDWQQTDANGIYDYLSLALLCDKSFKNREWNIGKEVSYRDKRRTALDAQLFKSRL